MKEICRMALPTHELLEEQVRLKSVSKEGHFTIDAESVFRPISPSIAGE
jgi:hypothetical protein